MVNLLLLGHQGFHAHSVASSWTQVLCVNRVADCDDRDRHCMHTPPCVRRKLSLCSCVQFVPQIYTAFLGRIQKIVLIILSAIYTWVYALQK